jgi:asparagine synthase (glutamine-hydrolysing)
VCGISGYTHRRAGVSGRARIEEATDSLVHRGPDQQGTYQSKYVSLGAVRLKILDMSSGGQPMVSGDGNLVLVFNGEIYNYRELRSELESRGHKFATRCDTEVLLQAFQEWDKDCFRRLRGMFAAALWNENERRLVLARDRVGIKPLYICKKGEDLYFGSELKSLFAHPEITREIDHVALHYYLALNYVPTPHTLVKGIEKLLPGSILEWTDGTIRQEQFWTPKFATDPAWTADSAQEALDVLLAESMREHMIADVPVGVWLSGGVDSSTILHYARRHSSSRLKTFSICFAGRSFDESRYARKVAKQYGTEHYELDLNPGLDLEGAVEEMAYYSDEPFADAGAVPLWFLSMMSRRHVTVALSGEGSDELFGGYATYRADRLAEFARRVPRSMRRSLLGVLRYWPVSNEKISLEYKVKRFVEGSLLGPDEAHTYWNGAFSRGQQEQLLQRTTDASIGDLFQRDLPGLATDGYLSRYLAFDQHYYLTDDLLQKVDRMSMAHSLEVRPPFLDHRIVEFAASLPDHLKIDGRRQKVVLKKLMNGKLPPAILKRPKTGLDIPTHDWFRGALRGMLLETLSASAVKETNLFRPEAIDRLIADHLEHRANVGYHLWGLLILFLWMKQWNIQSSPEVEKPELVAALAARV